MSTDLEKEECQNFESRRDIQKITTTIKKIKVTNQLVKRKGKIDSRKTIMSQK